ncbi:thiamine pyrophosphate-binding protein, partial [Mycobacteriaceae bacterium Msp059]|nr:thiamine pyrophosphate-binding protein [Mycobacteriaceae bacterium Msp059]
MFDQASLVREFVKWDYELRDPRQVESVVDRALSVATAHPQGPVYLALPREVLAEPAQAPAVPVARTPVPSTVQPDPDSIEALADRLAAAEFPVIVATANGIEPESVELLGDLATRFGIGIADPWARYLNIPYNHPHRVANMDVADSVFARADVIVFLESDVPWMETHTPPPADTYIAQIGVDPLYATYPIRSHRSDLNISATPAAFLTRLSAALQARADGIDQSRAEEIRAMASARQGRIDAQRRDENGRDADEPITAAAISAILDE